MSRNIEIKARVPNRQELIQRVESLTTFEQQLTQTDTFFYCNNGRLKLRQIEESESSELIFYQRDNSTEASLSTYVRTPIPKPDDIKSILQQTLGIRGVVRKVRHLYMWERTRIHVDQVDDLGNFVELEVVLDPSQTELSGKSTAQQLMQQLNIKESDLESAAYIDLLETKPAH